MEGKKRDDIKIGLEVGVVLKKDQRSGEVTYGKVKRILTKSKTHPHGIKVMLDNNLVGRVCEIK
ncbi:MAG: YwbE family protein [Clostridium sp.]|nr:YwbE family protein [Clostridium sp.]